nr:arginine deiminase family protein [Candidatus Njordarchaeum guaymaensis]
MDRFFDVVLVRSPASSYVNCVSTNPDKADIDVNLAKDQHKEYVSILKESGLRVIEFRPLEDFPDSVFMQDPALVGSRRAVIGRFGERIRRGEEKALHDDLRDHRVEVGKMHFVSSPGTLEGGDILVTDHGIFVGESRRTNRNGIGQLSTYLDNVEVKAVKTDLLHLLCGCSYLNQETMIIAPDLVSPELFPGFRFVTIPREEAYAADALYLGEGRVLVPSDFPRTIMKLRDAGYKPTEVEMSEFYKGDGGVTCLCSPVYKLF